MAAVIGEEASRLSRLVDNLLDLSRLEAGAAEPRRDWTSVEELIRAALSELAATPQEFSLSIDRELPLVSVDPVQMERAFVNVLENARRHSGGHPVSVRARAVRGLARMPGRASQDDDDGIGDAAPGGERPSGPRVIVRIVDRGPGIPPAQLERVFEPFYRAGTASGGPPRLGPRPGDRARLHAGERRLAARRVAARPGGVVRVRAAVARERRRAPRERSRPTGIARRSRSRRGT